MATRLPVHNREKELRAIQRADWVVVSVCMNPQMKRALAARAAAMGRSMAAEVRHVLMNVLVADGAGGESLLPPAPGDQVDQVEWWDTLLEGTED